MKTVICFVLAFLSACIDQRAASHFDLGEPEIVKIDEPALERPAVTSIVPRRGSPGIVAAGLATGGFVITRDAGATWARCDAADCAFAQEGVVQAPDGVLYTMLGPKLMVSSNGGAAWSELSRVESGGSYSLAIAPSNPRRLYVAGHYVVSGGENLPGVRIYVLFRSDDGGQSWQALPTSQLATMPNSTIEIAGISHTDPNLVFARVKLEDNAVSDAIYRSTDGGMTWTRILGKGSAIAFVVRRSELVAATQAQGAVRSTDNGDTWSGLLAPPHIGCLAESGGEVWACAAAATDGAAIVRSPDLASWRAVDLALVGGVL